MDKKLDCEIVRDLLPSYVDKLTSETTNRAVEEHLSGCPDCAEALRLMKEPEPAENHSNAEVDYLKKARRHTRHVGIICGIVMMVIGMLLIFSRVYLFGSESDPENGNYSVSVVDNTVSVSGNLIGNNSGVVRIVFEESAGIVNVKVYTAPKAFFNSSAIDEQYTAQSDLVGMVRCGRLILWENGVAISRTTAELYAAKNPYVGDMPSNGKVASVLGICDQIGPYTNELQTSAEPYGWTLDFETRISAENESAAREIMAADSYVMLAAIDNLGYVTWRYTTDAGQQEYTVTAEDATAFAGKEIKQCAASASELQSLMQSLNISIQRSIVREN